MHESAYISAINKLLPSTIYRWKIHDSYTSGVPDTYYSGDKADLWVEYKLVRDTPSKHTPKLSELQKKWLREQYNRGRNVAVIVGVKGGKGFIAENLSWEQQIKSITPITKRQIADWIINKVN